MGRSAVWDVAMMMMMLMLMMIGVCLFCFASLGLLHLRGMKGVTVANFLAERLYASVAILSCEAANDMRAGGRVEQRSASSYSKTRTESVEIHVLYQYVGVTAPHVVPFVACHRAIRRSSWEQYTP